MAGQIVAKAECFSRHLNQSGLFAFDEFRMCIPFEHGWRQKYQQLFSLMAIQVVAEQSSDDRNVSQPRNLSHNHGLIIGNHAAKYDCLS